MASAPPQAKVDVGRVLSRGFAALRANFLPFFAVSLLLAGAPGFLTQYLTASGFQTKDLDYLLSLALWGPMVGSIFGTLLAGALLQAVLVRSTILWLGGRDPDLKASALLGLRLLLPIIGVTLCVGILAGLGLLVLVVPGVMVYCAFFVSIPALVEERRGVFGSMQRSRDLTRGSRWQVFLLLVLFILFSAMVSGVLGAVTGVTTTATLQPTLPDPILAGAVSAVVDSLTALVVAVVLAALYVELRTVKEGATTDHLVDIFA